MAQRFAACIAGAALALAIAWPVTARANDGVDPTTTGAVQPAGVPESQVAPSAGFLEALDRLATGDAAAAYDAAQLLDNGAERRAIQWAAIFFHPGALDHSAIEQFAADAPAFATENVYRIRAERALAALDTPPLPERIVSLLGNGRVPATVEGRIMLATAYLAVGDTQRATSLTRSLWIDEFLTQEQEKRVLEQLGTLIDNQAHFRRATHLMMHDRARGSERLLPFLTEAQQSLVVARAAVSRNAADAKALLDAVDPSLQDHPVFVFSRAQRARQFELWGSAVDWLDQAPAIVPDAAEWWYERRTLVRQLLDVGEAELAYRAAAGYRTGPEGRLVEAQFHAGWIALNFLDRPEAARDHFTAMAAVSTLPDSITQAQYWLGRANRALGDTEAAEAAFAAAARHPTVYYGQLARAELGEAGVEIRPLPDWQQSRTLFEADPVVQAVRLLAAGGQKDMALPLLRHHAANLDSGGAFVLAARLAQELGAHHLAITIAGLADQKGFPLDPVGFPADGLPEDAQVAADRAAVFAVARQESMFQLGAVSSAGARGLMQLMPGTARDVAREVGVDYSASRLVTDADYNVLLGSTYLQTQLDRYDGSLVLAAAAYNAGPGNANRWIRAYGDPRLDHVDPVIWVELIPFQETRTYVKRVLGNYLVYRAQLGGSPVSLQQALRRID